MLILSIPNEDYHSPSVIDAAELKQALYMGDAEFSARESDIDAYIATAVSQFEFRTQRKVGRQAVVEYYDNLCVSIKTGPVISVDLIEYKDINGVWQTVSAEDYHYLSGDMPDIKPVGVWPDVSGESNAVRVTYTAGYEEVPEVIKSWVKLAVKHLFDGCGDGAGIPRDFCVGIIDQYKLYV